MSDNDNVNLPQSVIGLIHYWEGRVEVDVVYSKLSKTKRYNPLQELSKEEIVALRKGLGKLNQEELTFLLQLLNPDVQ